MTKVLIASTVLLIISAAVYAFAIIKDFTILHEIATEVLGASAAGVAIGLIADKSWGEKWTTI